jgi:uncharacterized protein
MKKNSLKIKDAKLANSFLDQLLGLHRKSNPRTLIFKTRFGIHTFFLKESIDVIILDSGLIVVKIATIKPNKIFFWNPKYDTVIELPKGFIKKSKLKLGDNVVI